jgi:hypothetical protein
MRSRHADRETFMLLSGSVEGLAMPSTRGGIPNVNRRAGLSV